MSEYKGYEISTTTMHVEPGKIFEVGYRAIKAGTVVYSKVLPGPFKSDEYARAAAAWAARRWIDQHGT